ncbi:MAG TPA: glycosyltransferase family 4 protein [Candidatus Dormibacteraeota bacterium]|nr:glycosyltransferase family 4 protein [Candidatus Dormibacteraeota bacterium]
MRSHREPRICVVGAGTHFLSGISYYTMRLANALAGRHRVSVILMRRLLPARFYPGRSRVGASLGRFEYGGPTESVDWFWFPSILRAVALLVRERPDVAVFQWWSATALHSYVFLALVTRVLGGRVIIEFHELLDTAEARLPIVYAYVRFMAPVLLRLASGTVVHSEFDRAAVRRTYRIGRRPVLLVPHGPYDQYVATVPSSRSGAEDSCNLLFFGVIRPFKGLEDLIVAFDAIPQAEIARYRLTIVGETWEGWTKPADLIARSRYRDRITFINRYVHDDEVGQVFAEADAVVLPYHRSSASGPLQIAMSCGLPVVVTAVGGLPEAVGGYDGAILVPARDPDALRHALGRAAALRGRRFSDPHSWTIAVEHYDRLFAAFRAGRKAVQGAVA